MCYEHLRQWVKDLHSARRPLLHSEEVPVPTYRSTREPSCEEITKVSSDSDIEEIASSEPKLFTQKELNDLIRDLGLSKESGGVLASRLKEKKLVGVRYESDVLSYKRAKLATIF
ncbi:unnamed protein product [Diatraea saccharalis]|uniref:Uncharacterized protein n=1 Tax=Diatraea saccharalis TaxID=40085 RepID=A0A9N9WD46_9NEOP|nr:unnamed protein product [Diatraea saccharalis]